MEWVADIAKIDSRMRSRHQWARLGEHHAQALVARHLPSMWPDEWAVYVRSVLAGARCEIMRLSARREQAYWIAYREFLDRIVAMETPRRNAGLRRVV